MRAALLYGKGDIRVGNVKMPDIGMHELLLKVKSSFICGTDVRMFENGYAGISESTPLILGHEMSGVIERAGDAVSGYRKGMRVAVAPNMGCGRCGECVSGNTHLCRDYKAFGINLNGGFAEYVCVSEMAVRQGNVIEIDDSISFEDAALAEPLSCVYNAYERSNIRPGDTVLIIGAGPIGIMHAKFAKMGGASRVIINDLSAVRLEQCKRIDSSFITVGINDLKERVMDITNNKGVDVSVTACPSPQAQIASLELAAINGRIIFFGGLPKDICHVSLDTNMIHYKQLLVTGTTKSSLSQFRKTLELISSGLINVKDMITTRFSVDDISLAFEKAANGIGLKNTIEFDQIDQPKKVIDIPRENIPETTPLARF